MRTNELNLRQQLALCKQIARLVRAKLPLVGQLADGPTAQETDGIQHPEQPEQPDSAARLVESRLADGQSLAQALAADDSRDSRILSACIQAGEACNALDETLESWTSMHIANSKSSQAMLTAMLYPAALIGTVVVALGFVFWLIIPEYQETYRLFDQTMPGWLQAIVWLHEHSFLLILFLLFASVLPLIVWIIRRRQTAPSGLPLEPTRRARLQALSTELAAIMLRSRIPLNQLASWAVQAGGGGVEDAQEAFGRLRQQQPVTPLAPETSMLLSALHIGLLRLDQAEAKLRQVAEHLRQGADLQARRQVHWLPMLVAVTVGCITILTYVFLIYLPWIWLLLRIVQPNTTTEL